MRRHELTVGVSYLARLDSLQRPFAAVLKGGSGTPEAVERLLQVELTLILPLGVGLPGFNKSVAYQVAVAVDYGTNDFDPLTLCSVTGHLVPDFLIAGRVTGSGQGQADMHIGPCGLGSSLAKHQFAGGSGIRLVHGLITPSCLWFSHQLLVFKVGLQFTAYHQVETIGQAVHRVTAGHIQTTDHGLDGVAILDGIDDGALRNQRVAFEVHLGDQAGGDRQSHHRDVNVGRTPAIHIVGPGVRTRLDGAETVPALLIGQTAAHATETGVQRRQIAIITVAVAPTGIGLPHLYQSMRYRFAELVDHTTKHNDALALRQDMAFAFAKVKQQIVVMGPHAQMTEVRSGKFRHGGLLHADQGLLRRAGNRGLVTRGIGRRMPVTITLDEALVFFLHDDHLRGDILLAWSVDVAQSRRIEDGFLLTPGLTNITYRF